MSGERRLKVAFIGSPGPLDYALELAAILAQGSDLLLMIDSSTPEARREAVGARKVWSRPWPRHRQAFASLRHLFALRKAIIAFDADLVHVVCEGQVWLILLRFLIGSRPLVVTLHDVFPHPGDTDTLTVPRSLVNAFVRGADAVIVHGQGLKTAAVEGLGLRPERVFLSLHPIIWRYRRLAEALGLKRADDGRVRVLNFGRIFPYKGLKHLVAAFRKIEAAAPNAMLVIAGKGECPEAAEAAKALPGKVQFLNHRISDEDLAQLLLDADVMALPYVEASQSGVLNVAVGCGLPVVASDVGELGPLVRETGVGLLAPPGDEEALARALEALLANPDQRRACQARCEDLADGALSDAVILEKTLAAYRFALSGRT